MKAGKPGTGTNTHAERHQHHDLGSRGKHSQQNVPSAQDASNFAAAPERSSHRHQEQHTSSSKKALTGSSSSSSAPTTRVASRELTAIDQAQAQAAEEGAGRLSDGTLRASEDIKSDASVGENITVVVRVRPLNELELQTCGERYACHMYLLECVHTYILVRVNIYACVCVCVCACVCARARACVCVCVYMRNRAGTGVFVPVSVPVSVYYVCIAYIHVRTHTSLIHSYTHTHAHILAKKHLGESICPEYLLIIS